MKNLIQYRKDIFEGRDIRLRAVLPSDSEVFAKWWNEDSLLLGNRSRVFETYESENEKLIYGWSNPDKKDGFGLSIENKNGELVGHLSSFGLAIPERIATLAIFIAEEHQGKGYGSQAMEKGIQLAFEELNAHKVEVNVFSYNDTAIHVYEKVGFKIEGRRRAAVYHHGQYFDVLTMGILREEYNGRN